MQRRWNCWVGWAGWTLQVGLRRSTGCRRASRTDGEGCREGAGTALNCLNLAGVRKLKDLAYPWFSHSHSEWVILPWEAVFAPVLGIFLGRTLNANSIHCDYHGVYGVSHGVYWWRTVPSGNLLHDYGKIHPFFMVKFTISMVIFHSYFDITRGYFPFILAN